MRRICPMRNTEGLAKYHFSNSAVSHSRRNEWNKSRHSTSNHHQHLILPHPTRARTTASHQHRLFLSKTFPTFLLHEFKHNTIVTLVKGNKLSTRS
ncbi:hypothetical protein CC79DRAFT_88823 [Sarocladium strictum]